MADPMADAPERVWLLYPASPDEPGYYTTIAQKGDEIDGLNAFPIYVPESRALTAEQERDEHLKWRTVEQEIGDKQRADLAALREQVRVFTPLARLGLMARDMAFDDAYLSDTMARSMFIGRIQCFVDDNQMTLNDDTDPPTIAAARTILEANDV